MTAAVKCLLVNMVMMVVCDVFMSRGVNVACGRLFDGELWAFP